MADALLDLYGRHGVAASILLRGSAGFGRLHHLRDDRMEERSYDLPLVSIAVDSRQRIETLLGGVSAIARRGLITLERVRLLGGGPDDGAPAPTTPWEGPVKLTVHLGRGERAGGLTASTAICDLLHRRRLAGASVLSGVDGTRHGRRVRARFFAGNAAVPAIVVAVGAAEPIAAALPDIRRVARDPVITLERVQVCKHDGELLGAPRALPGPDEHGLAFWQKLVVYSSFSATHEGRPVHAQIVRRLREAGAAGATTLSGTRGFRGGDPPQGDRLFQLRRRVPAVTIALDTPAAVARWFAIVDELTAEHGLVTVETVPAMRAMSEARRQGGLTLAPPHP